jgi:heme exporter protein C
MTADLGPAAALIRRGQWITAIALVGVAVVMYLAWFVAPVEARQGMAQKIFYIHVPSATMALWVAVPALGIASILYLWLADPRLDRFAASSAEVATVFCGATLLTGPLWAKPIWGTWWTWDGRLTLTLFLFFLLLGYQTLRASLRDPHERGRFSSVLGIMGMVLVPFIHLSVYLWRGLHPQPILLKPSAPSLPWEMLRVMLTGLAVFLVLYVGLVTMRYGIQLARDTREVADAA